LTILGVHDAVDVKGRSKVGADARDRLRSERAQVALGLRRDRGGRPGERVQRVAEEVLSAGADDAFRTARRSTASE
jgi:hypothetical protein